MWKARLIKVAMVVFVLGCSSGDKGTDTGNGGPVPVTGRIGSEGGMIEIPGQIKLIIPANALLDTVEFSIVQNTSPPPRGIKEFASPVFTIEPSDTSFNSPCTLIIYYNESLLGGVPEDSVNVCIYTGGDWEILSSIVDAESNTSTAIITHLSDYADMFAPPGAVEFANIVDITEKGLEFFFEFFDGVLYVMQLHQYEILQPPGGVRYYREPGRYEFDINVTGEPGDNNEVTGFIIPTDTAYYWDWVCTEWEGDVCIDSEYVATDTIPPTYIADGFQQNEVALFAWTAKRRFPEIHTVGAGTFSLRMLDHTRYWYTLADRILFFPYDDLGIFEITSLGYSWDVETRFNDTSHHNYTYDVHFYRCNSWDTSADPDTCLEWVEVYGPPYDSVANFGLIDSTYVCPNGSMEFVVRSEWFSDSLYVLMTFSEGNPISTISGTYTGQARNMTIDLRTFEISY